MLNSFHPALDQAILSEVIKGDVNLIEAQVALNMNLQNLEDGQEAVYLPAVLGHVQKFLGGFVGTLASDDHLEDIEAVLRNGSTLESDVLATIAAFKSGGFAGIVGAVSQAGKSLIELARTLEAGGKSTSDIQRIKTFIQGKLASKTFANDAMRNLLTNGPSVQTNLDGLQGGLKSGRFDDVGQDAAQIVILVLGQMPREADNHAAFMQYLAKHGKSYATQAEFDFRLAQYEERVAEHKRHNSMPGQTSTQGENFLTDRTDEEITAMLGFRSQMNAKRNETSLEVGDVAPVDWRAKGAVTPVKNQGQCGSCWSFSTTGCLEGAHFVKTNKLVSLSESQFVNCSHENHGCNGGSMDLAFMYAEKSPVMREADWPYEPYAEPLSCYTKYRANKGVVTVSSYKDVPQGQPDQLKAFLANGPVSVAIEADRPAFQQYTGGVITGDACGSQLDHGVLAVGWGSDNSHGNYFIVKNSWGPTWGEKGFVRLSAASNGGKGVCGILLNASQAYTD